jgi:hypothetical protein
MALLGRHPRSATTRALTPLDGPAGLIGGGRSPQRGSGYPVPFAKGW